MNGVAALETTEESRSGSVRGRFARGLSRLAIPLLLSACGGAPPAPSAPSPTPAATETSASQPEGHWLVASVPRGTFGPHWARRDEARLAVWAVPDGDAAGWYSLSLPRNATPQVPLRLGDVSPGLQMMRLRPDGASGFVLLTTRAVQEAHVVEAWHLGPEGVLRSGPHLLGESPAPIVWIDAVPTRRGALVAWAERIEGRADLYVVPSGPAGPERAPRRAVRRAAAWQLAAFGRSAALATVEESSDGMDVFVRFVGDDGREAAPATRVSSSRIARPEIDLLVHRERTLIAWTEQRPSGRRLMLAQLERDGSLRHAPWPATPPRGDQMLLELIGHRDGASYVAWEEAARRPLTGSVVSLAIVGAPGTTFDGPEVGIDVRGYDGTLPLLAARDDGLLAATRAPVCREQDTCEAGDDVIVTVDFRGDLTPSGVLPVRSGAGSAPADLLWDLHCAEECWALTARSAGAAGKQTPTHVHLTRLTPEPGWRSPAHHPDGHTVPRTLAQTRVSDALELSGLTAWNTPEGPVLAWLSYFDPWTPWVTPKKPAPDGRLAPVRALLRAQALAAGADREELLPATEETISWRAHSPGGLGVAPGDGQERLLVWSALDDGEPQVFATIVDQRGKRLRQRMITRTPGAVQDVAAVRLDSAWLLAWVDGRGGTPEVYAARVDDRLESLGTQAALSEGARDPTGVHLLRRGELVFATWSDSHGADVSVRGDIYLAVLSAHDGSVISPARRISVTPLHSHSPRLVARASGALLAWLEVDHEASKPAALLTLEIDDAGRPLGSPRPITLEGRPATFALACERGCRAALVLDRGPRSELWGLSWHANGAEASAHLLAALAGRQTEAVAPVLVGDSVYYVDGAESEDPGLHRLDAVWR